MRQSLLILTGLIFVGCNKFENRFYDRIDQAQINCIKHGSDTIDLTTITDFEWDSVMLIRGNESVPVFKEEIEEAINKRVSKIHWEERRLNERNDTLLKFKTTDLPTFKDRFYFLTPDKKLIEKEIESGVDIHSPAFELNYCLADSVREKSWLSKSECKFIVKSNSKTIGQGTVFLFPSCPTRFSPDKVKVFE